MKPQRFKKIKFGIRAKLIFAFSIPLLALIVTAWINMHQLDTMNKQLNSVVEIYSTKQLLASNIRQDILKIHRAEMNFITALKTEEMEKHAARIDKYESIALKRLDELYAVVTPEEKENLVKFREIYVKLKKINLGARKLSNKISYIKARNISVNKGRLLFDQLDAILDSIIVKSKEDMIRIKEIACRDYIGIKNSTSMIVLIFIFLSLYALFYAIRSISIPIEKLKDFADNIEKGRLDANVEIEEDEISSLANLFKNMARNLVIYADRTKRLIKIETKVKVESKKARKLKAAYKKLKEMQEMLIQIEKMNAIGQLASGVAHEVRNPLAIITQGIDYLEKKLPLSQEDISETVQTVKENIKRADNIINALIDFSKASQLQLKPEDALSILESALVLIQHDIRMDGVEIIKELEEGLPKVLADRGKLEQVFINLFLNAIQAMPRGGKIFIRCYARELDQLKNGIGRRDIDYFRIGERALIIEIEDTGVGISRKNLHRVFEPFFTTKKIDKGTGLGLSVTKSIIVQHRGLIEIESKLHKGAKIIITLKISEGS